MFARENRLISPTSGPSVEGKITQRSIPNKDGLPHSGYPKSIEIESLMHYHLGLYRATPVEFSK